MIQGTAAVGLVAACKGQNSSRFRVTDAAGHTVLILCNYSGSGLVEGEQARVRYVVYNRKLLEMDMLPPT
jgi:hypothetical protein